jgi:adenine-specific DNA-methyltransferase
VRGDHQVTSKYEGLSQGELVNLLIKRDAQAKLGLVWERDEFERDQALNDSFVALELNAADSLGEGPYRNMVIKAENFDAMRWLRMTMAGRVKLIYLDPPYNTGNKDWVYNDSYVNKTDRFRHSMWLEWMHTRLELARDLLAPDGAIFASIDDNEGAQFKLLLEQVFGPRRFRASFIWQKVDSPNDNKPVIAADHEFIHCFASDEALAKWSKMPDASILAGFSKRNDEGRLYRDRILRKNGKASLRTDREGMHFKLEAPDGTAVWPIRADGKEGRWSHAMKGVEELRREKRLIWKEVTQSDGTLQWTPYAREFAKEEPSKPYPTIWTDVETTRQSKDHHKQMFPGEDPFVTPKPEPLMARILQIATQEDDLVLDLFLGSGTTAAVAMKMNRRFIGIESVPEIGTGAIMRLDAVRQGEEGGISKAIEWEGTEEPVGVFSTKRIEMADLVYDLTPPQVWCAVQATSNVPITDWDPGKAVQSVETSQVTVCYCDRVSDAAIVDLIRLATTGRPLSVYAYTPGPFRDALSAFRSCEVYALPDVLLRNFAS